MDGAMARTERSGDDSELADIVNTGRSEAIIFLVDIYR